VPVVGEVREGHALLLFVVDVSARGASVLHAARIATWIINSTHRQVRIRRMAVLSPEDADRIMTGPIVGR